MGAWQSMANFFGFSAPGGKENAQAFIRNAGGSDNPNRNLSMHIFPSSFERAKGDLASVALALKEAEKAGYPFRTELQKIYEKTILNGHVASCIQRRKELTILRGFEIRNANNECDKTWTEYFQKSWYRQHVLPHILNAQYHGFSLISIGAITDGVPDLITSVKRWNISPDRKHVSIFERSPSGFSWEDSPYDKWHIWVPTLQENGISNCGYGLLLVTAVLEILLRNNIQYNADFIEMFANPFRWLKTADLEGEEYEEKKRSMAEMGHNGYLITNLTDELEFLTDGARGNGYKAYNDFDHRNKSDISKWIGGHADFIDSVTKNPGLGSQNSGGGDVTDDATGNSQVQKAIAAKRAIDGDFVAMITNERVIPTLQRLGVNIPRGHKICFLNDNEERVIASQEADKNQKIATLALTMAQGGLKMSAEYFKKQTGVDCSEVEISPDKNVVKDTTEMAEGKGPLKDASKKREDKPKHTE
jgi:hypothetical protein